MIHFLIAKTVARSVYFFAFLLSFICLSCSSDDSDEGGDSVDLSVVEGWYVGLLSSDLTTFGVSATLEETSNGRYSVKLYETSSWMPMHNSDGVTPEVTGTIIVDGMNATADLFLSSDLPSCTGNYDGDGTRDNEQGKFTLQMDYNETCNGANFTGSFTYTLTKVRDIQ